jgi:hypothetical protein
MMHGNRPFVKHEDAVTRDDLEGQMQEAILYIEELEEGFDDLAETVVRLDTSLSRSEKKRQNLIDCLPILVVINVLLVLWNVGAGYYGFAVGAGVLALFVGFCWWAAEGL